MKRKAICWSSKHLSRAGKMVMLRSVLATIPSHAMSCFKLPQTLCAQIQSLLTRFWWDSTQDKRKMSWISWKKMTKPKKLGGLGFKDIPTFNDALLAKLSWRIITKPSCLLARCLLGKHCKEEPFLSVQAAKSSSHGWKSVLIGRDLLVKHLGWIVGTGTNISVWNDPWLSTLCQQRPFGPAPEAFKDLLVANLMMDNSTEWDTHKIDLVLPFHKAEVLQIKLSICNGPDELVWLRSQSGEYSTKSGYKTQMETLINEERPVHSMNQDWLANVWNLKAAEKIKLFLWSALHDALPVGEQFSVRNIPLSNSCTRCNETESVFHVLFTCTYAHEVWDLAPLASTLTITLTTTTWTCLDLLRRIPFLPPTGLGPGILSAWICWNLWISRNQLIFQKRHFSPEETILKAIREAREWTSAQNLNPTHHQINPRINQDPNLVSSRTCMYTDAAWNPSTKCAGLAWIIDDAGSSSSHSATATFVASPLTAETLALRDAMTSALHCGINALLICSDSQILINLVNSRGRHVEIAVLLKDIQFLSTLFNVVEFKFIPRLDNHRADRVAKHALSIM